MSLRRSALAASVYLGKLIFMNRRVLFALAISCLLAACVSFRDGPFVPLSGRFVGAAQAKDYERRQISKSDLRTELGEPAEVSGHDVADQWTYVSVRRRTGVERRGFTEKVTCQFVRDTHVFSFVKERVSTVTTSSKVWQATGADYPGCVEP